MFLQLSKQKEIYSKEEKGNQINCFFNIFFRALNLKVKQSRYYKAIIEIKYHKSILLLFGSRIWGYILNFIKHIKRPDLVTSFLERYLLDNSFIMLLTLTTIYVSRKAHINLFSTCSCVVFITARCGYKKGIIYLTIGKRLTNGTILQNE